MGLYQKMTNPVQYVLAEVLGPIPQRGISGKVRAEGLIIITGLGVGEVGWAIEGLTPPAGPYDTTSEVQWNPSIKATIGEWNFGLLEGWHYFRG